MSAATASPLSRNRSVLTLLRTAPMVLLLLVFFVVLAIVEPSFMQVGNLRNVLTTASILAIPGIGMTLLIASGAFDLSVGSTLALTGVVTASLIPTQGLLFGVTIGLVVAALVGTTNGLIVTKLRISPLIATLAMLTIVRGAALVYTDGRDQLVTEPAFKFFSAYRISGIPVPILLMLAILLFAAHLLHRTSFGRHLLAVGSNADAARISGLRVDRIRIAVFAFVGFTAGLWGLIVASQLQKGSATLGVGSELDVIAVAVIGGTPLSGGKAALTGTFLGAVLITVLRNGLNLLNVGAAYQQIAIGTLLVATIAIHVAIEKRGGDLDAAA